MKHVSVIVALFFLALSLPFFGQETVWVEGFEADECGWLFIDNDGDGRNWTITDNNPHDGLRCLFGGYSPTTEDNWAISPAIAIPNDESMKTLKWQVFGHANYIESYEVLVTTGDSGYLAAYDSLFSESVSGGYFERSIDISPYSGQTIRIAFRHRSQNQNFICIDDVSITHHEELPPQPPVVTIAAPTTATVGENVILSAQCDNADRFIWDIEGTEPSSPNSRTTTATWNREGRYRISVTAINDDGSSTADHIITILPKNGIADNLEPNPSPLLYPNPTSNIVHIKSPTLVSVDIFSTNGKKVAHSNLNDIAVDSFPNGVYTTIITTADGVFVDKFIKR